MQQNKKSQSISINTIIIAALALAALVVIIYIFSGQLGITSKNINSCIAKGGTCAKTYEKGCPPEGSPDYTIPLIVGGIECKDSNGLCCLKNK